MVSGDDIRSRMRGRGWLTLRTRVAGWALTLLSKENLSYASTAQTVGLNTGYFLSFTVFLAFNSIEFR